MEFSLIVVDIVIVDKKDKSCIMFLEYFDLEPNGRLFSFK